MKYIAFILAFLLAVSVDSCGQRGIYWKFDGVRHTFVWGDNR